MNKVLIIIIMSLLSICSFSQEHIKFNGATFGQRFHEFAKVWFKGGPITVFESRPRDYNANLYNLNCCLIPLNSYKWTGFIYSSKRTDTVFKTVCIKHYHNNLEQQTTLLVKALEEKYGGGVQEKQGNLGVVDDGNSSYREMLALYYYVKGKNGKRIGEIRISVAPACKNGQSGCIELIYTDYDSQNKANREYNDLMHDAL